MKSVLGTIVLTFLFIGKVASFEAGLYESPLNSSSSGAQFNINEDGSWSHSSFYQSGNKICDAEGLEIKEGITFYEESNGYKYGIEKKSENCFEVFVVVDGGTAEFCPVSMPGTYCK